MHDNRVAPMSCVRARCLLLVSCAVLAEGAAPARGQSDSPEWLYQRGLDLFMQGDYGGAVEKFRPIVDLFSEEPELREALEQVYYALGSSYYNQQRYGEAIETFTVYAERYPDARFIDEALFRIGAAHQAQQAFAEAVAAYRRLIEQHPRSEYAEDGAFQIGVAYLTQDDFAQVIETFTHFGERYPRSPLYPQAMMFLARAYFETDERDSALEVLAALGQRTKSLEHIAYVNFLAMEIGDAAFEETDYDTALRAYRRVRTRASLLRLQRRFVEQLEETLQELERRPSSANTISTHFREERRARSSLRAARDMLARLQGMPAYDAGLFHRIGSCFANSDRYWEARVAFQRVVDEAQDKAIREAAHFDLALVLSRLRRFEDLTREADRYLARYGNDPDFARSGRVASMAFMRAESYIQEERFEEAETEMRTLLETYPEHVQRERVTFYLALSVTMQERFDEGVRLFREWLSRHPEHVLSAEVEYWMSIALFYDGRHEEALPRFQDYAAKYPHSVYAPEAAYRAALCQYALERFEESARALERWIADHPDHYFQWEALVIRGDALAAAGRLAEAKATYKQVTKEAGPFYFLALNQAARVYRALDTEADMREMARLFIQYVHDNPDSPNVVDAAHQAGLALRRIGKVQEARRYYWSILQRYGNNRDWEGFSRLIDDLKSLYGEDEREAQTVDMQAALRKAKREGRRTLAARLELARVPSEPEEERLVASYDLARNYEMDVLGAAALAYLGAFFLDLDKPGRAGRYFDRLLTEFPESRHAAVAHLNKARVHLAAGEYEQALDASERAIVGAYEPEVMMEAVFVRAQGRRHLQMYELAIEDFNQILAQRAAPRALKPQAMLGLAACLEAQGDHRRAIPYYQRVYVLYGAYRDAVVEAYLRSGKAFEKLGDYEAAIRTYRELLADTELRQRPEAEEARARLAELET